ncbi:hypothetical protein ABEB36_014916 [Hypothenemus hampei]|uniref:Transposase n=1 Tax=Hypothenemus hampei TaxID=57062 RepID=A0ABD1E1J5_HYPHA
MSLLALVAAPFLPPVVIFEGQPEKKEFADGLLLNSFKPEGKTLLILTVIPAAAKKAEVCREKWYYLVCPPSHITQVLQPLDRAFLKFLKHNLKHDAHQWMTQHPGRQLRRIQASQIIEKHGKNPHQKKQFFWDLEQREYFL